MKKERNRNIGFSFEIVKQNERQMLPLSKQYWIYSDPTKVGTETVQISFKLPVDSIKQNGIQNKHPGT